MKVICSSEESLYRPEAVRWRNRMEMMEPLGDTVVLLPCSMKKPYSNSKSHQKFRKLTRSFQELIVTSPFGICPRELENTFPIQSYDVSTTGSWSQDEINESGKLIEKYCKGKKVVANLSGGYLKSCEAYLDDFVASLENGLDTDIGERGTALSGGQRQRLAIARAIVKDAPIVILDEATSALDNKAEAVVQKAIDNLMSDRTVFVIAHRLSTIQNADMIVVLNDGEIIETGTHEQLMQKPNGAYQTLYNAQFKNK